MYGVDSIRCSSEGRTKFDFVCEAPTKKWELQTLVVMMTNMSAYGTNDLSNAMWSNRQITEEVSQAIYLTTSKSFMGIFDRHIQLLNQNLSARIPR
jgi:hypothetical protein